MKNSKGMQADYKERVTSDSPIKTTGVRPRLATTRGEFSTLGKGTQPSEETELEKKSRDDSAVQSH